MREVNAQIASLKWTEPRYVKELQASMGVDYRKAPAEDFARAIEIARPDNMPARRDDAQILAGEAARAVGRAPA